MSNVVRGLIQARAYNLLSACLLMNRDRDGGGTRKEGKGKTTGFGSLISCGPPLEWDLMMNSQNGLAPHILVRSPAFFCLLFFDDEEDK